MNDYLWNKTGSDPELEALEDKLSELRIVSQTTDLHRFVPQESTKRVSRWWKLTVAVPAMAAAVLASIWLLPDYKSSIESGITGEALSKPQFQIQARSKIEAIQDSLAKPEKISRPAQFRAARRMARARVNYRKRVPRSAKRARKPAPQKEAAPVLTTEEEFAYSQLMKALTITSSKLNLVKEKAGGSEPLKGAK